MVLGKNITFKENIANEDGNMLLVDATKLIVNVFKISHSVYRVET